MAKTPIPETQPLQFKRALKSAYRAVIAIPCCNEFESLPGTLRSLEENGAVHYDQTLIIVNVNQRASMEREGNLRTLSWLQEFDTPLQLAWMDHVNGAGAFPEKFGVGLARHQACQRGLDFIEEHDPVISLDADSPVSPNYLSAISDYMETNPDFRAGHVNFQHRHCGNSDERRAIQVYEQHLKQHRQRLAEAKSPHAWYAIGSTIVCTKAAYLKAGGYHCRRMAGEDFYLLQQLSKTGCEIAMIADAFVYPSDRVSDRVPFGTGRAVGEIVENGHWLTYHTDCYRDLAQLLDVVDKNLTKSGPQVIELAPLTCRGWLEQREFSTVWPKLQANSRDDVMLRQKFHEWLDAFQTLKLIHYLSDEFYPRVRMASEKNDGS